MSTLSLTNKAAQYMQTLCADIGERCVGSAGNREATDFFRRTLRSFGWEAVTQDFNAIDWEDGGAELSIGATCFDVLVSPYSLPFSGTAPLAAASTAAELETGSFEDKIVLLHGEIAKEQLMPKNFVFYNPDEHRKIVSLLEESGAAALICATGRNAALAGGVYPFPLIEDGDFDIPSVYMTEEEGNRLLPFIGETAAIDSRSRRIPGNGYNVIGVKGGVSAKNGNPDRIVVTAHIDAKKGTPGAIDNSSGVAVLLLLAELLRDYSGDTQIELAALNGEDYFSVPGHMKYIEANQNSFDTILLNINIDGAGYKEGKSAFSFYDLPEPVTRQAAAVIKSHSDIIEGDQWYQGDHSVFIQNGRPALAVSSQWFIDNIETQEITHTEKDNLEIIDYRKIVDIAETLGELIVLI